MSDREAPWWKVNGIFDPDGDGADFSYTVGLAERDLPELHMWARPSLGDDPGSDWHFSLRDTCGLLNGAARRLLDGSLTVGDTWHDTFDEGYVTARFRVEPPVPAEEVDAFEAAGSAVLPIRWELVRPAIGAPRELTPSQRVAAQEEYDELLTRLRADDSAPDGWALPEEPSWEADQRFGPRTPLVLARAAEIWQARPDEFIDVLDRAVTTDHVHRISYALVVARAAAREPGRTWALERLEAAAWELGENFGVTWGVEQADILRGWMTIDGEPASDDDWRRAHELLVEVITTCLVVEAMADLVPDRIVTRGQGVVRTAIGPQGRPPDARWACSDAVSLAVRQIMTSVPVAILVDASVAWCQRRYEPDCWPVPALMWSGACYPPLVTECLTREKIVLATWMLRELGEPLVVLQDWAGALATILSERAAIAEEAVAAFLSCASGVPGLRSLVNTPLVADPDR